MMYSMIEWLVCKLCAFDCSGWRPHCGHAAVVLYRFRHIRPRGSRVRFPCEQRAWAVVCPPAGWLDRLCAGQRAAGHHRRVRARGAGGAIDGDLVPLRFWSRGAHVMDGVAPPVVVGTVAGALGGRGGFAVGVAAQRADAGELVAFFHGDPASAHRGGGGAVPCAAPVGIAAGGLVAQRSRAPAARGVRAGRDGGAGAGHGRGRGG